MEHASSPQPTFPSGDKASSAPSPADQADSPTRRWSWKLGSLFGIDLHVHGTFFILVAWVAFSQLAQGHGLRAALESMALILAVFACVVLHELGHALTAKRFGIRTRDILLLPIGGIARLARMPERPIQELLVALAGPAVNVVLALGIAGLLALAGGTRAPDSIHVVGEPFLTRLMWINVSLAVFNLMPAFPMDGGRVLRAAFSFRMDRARATEVAARIGRGMALLFGIAGLFVNPMLLFIGLFVWLGATQESLQARLKASLNGIPLRSAMITEFRTLTPTEPLSRASELLLAGFQHDFPVIRDDGQLVGIVTRDDVVKGLAQGGVSVPVGQVMRASFATADSNEMLEGALSRLDDGTSLIVLDEGRLVGLLTSDRVAELIKMETALRTRQAPRLRDQ